MKKNKLKIFTLYSFFSILFISFVFADVELSTQGSIIINTLNELGNSISNCKVVLTLPGKDGELNKGADILFSSTDGEKDDDLNYFKGKKIADGDIELSPTTINSLELKNNQQLSINVMLDGYVNWSTTTKYFTSSINIIESQNQYNLKVINLNYSKEISKPFSVEISGNYKVQQEKEEKKTSSNKNSPSIIPAKAEIYSIMDGSEFDGDKEINGIIYFPLSISHSEDKKFTITIKDIDGKTIKRFQNFIIDGVRQSIIKF